MIRILFSSTVLMATSALWLSGCGESAKGPPTGRVTGTVTFQGKPVDEGRINFESDPPGYGAAADVKQGNFAVDGDVVVGNYKVTVTAPPPKPPVPGQTATIADPKDIPAKYRLTKTSDLVAKVQAGSNKLTFDLK